MWSALESHWSERLSRADWCQRIGRLTAVEGLLLRASGLTVKLGELVEIRSPEGDAPLLAEVVGLRQGDCLLMPYGATHGLSLDCEVVARGMALETPVGHSLLGRVIDALGQPLDALPLSVDSWQTSRGSVPINPLSRTPIDQVLETGVRCVDIFTPLGRGQRMGILAGSGVGKSTLLGMMSRYAEADVVVIALIGERGREVGDFMRDSLGSQGLRRAVVIVAAAEQPAILRRQAAYTATTIAEWFRAQGKHVLLIMDSITRFALAQREIGLAIAEPMGSRGYPPSVFALLPPLLERAGALQGMGSITALYTVLVEGDDMSEPVADHMRAILDGHIVLDRNLAARGRYPAVDVLRSISRLSGHLRSSLQKQIVERLLQALANYANSADLIELGAYQPGRNHELDRIVELYPQVERFLGQAPDVHEQARQAWQQAKSLTDKLEADAHAR